MTDLKRIPLSAFDPRFRALLERGCREPLEIPCTSRAEGLHLRNLLNTYRARLRKEFPHDKSQWEGLYGTIVSTKRGDDSIVTLKPRHALFDTALGAINAAAPPLLDADPLAEFFEEEKPA